MKATLNFVKIVSRAFNLLIVSAVSWFFIREGVQLGELQTKGKIVFGALVTMLLGLLLALRFPIAGGSVTLIAFGVFTLFSGGLTRLFYLIFPMNGALNVSYGWMVKLCRVKAPSA